MPNAGANPAYYRKLAIALAIGVVVAVVLGVTKVTGPGFVTVESGIVSLFLVAFVISVVLLFFLIRVGDIFSIESNRGREGPKVKRRSRCPTRGTSQGACSEGV